MDTTVVSDKPVTTGRKRTTINSSASSSLEACINEFQQPSSPASSSTSQTTGDTTFEPSIDMMVNDFDDEQTLTEEEALAELEAQDPADEIATLQKESEMPLEELLAHYKQHLEHQHLEQRPHKKKKSMKKKSKSRKQSTKQTHKVASTRGLLDEVIVIEESDDEVEVLKTERLEIDAAEGDNVQDATEEDPTVEDDDGVEEDGEVGDDEPYESLSSVDLPSVGPHEFGKRSHLLELYPENFANLDRKLDDDFSEDEEDDDSDYVKKTIMVGSAYQAFIPVGLSKYGDVLPYENEDKLIWEPSQVSEQEVEEYLIRVREIKSATSSNQDDDVPSSSTSVTSESDQGVGSNLVKDDEQALHLLVQCGYNFKEALRRKRLNAVPLTGSMSLWSEEECRNFEEGIQKFGKDFRKIRQSQVRTRSIRELVQFYYLWKKTERRDRDFVDSDTVDHMDVYLDFDERDTSTNGGAKHVTVDQFATNQPFQTKKQQSSASTSSVVPNFSIMNETKRSGASSSSHSKKGTTTKKGQSDCQTHPNTFRRRSSLLVANKSNQLGDNNSTFPINSAPEKSSRNNPTSTTTSSPAAVNSTTGTNSCKKS